MPLLLFMMAALDVHFFPDHPHTSMSASQFRPNT